MKEKIKNYFNDSNANEVRGSLNQNMFKKQIRRTLGSEDQRQDRIAWSTSGNNLTQFYSPPKPKNQLYDLQSLLHQNKKLRQEVKTLKQLLIDSSPLSISKTYQKLDATIKHRKDEKSEEILRLKKIIQKSYYSMMKLEGQISRVSQQLHSTTKNLNSLDKKYKLMQFQKQELERKIVNMSTLHKQQIETCHERIKKLDLVTQQLVQMVEQQQANWSLHMQELNNLKKFYSVRTSK